MMLKNRRLFLSIISIINITIVILVYQIVIIVRAYKAALFIPDAFKLLFD